MVSRAAEKTALMEARSGRRLRACLSRRLECRVGARPSRRSRHGDGRGQKEQADLKNNLAVLKNAELALERQRQLIQRGNTAKANFDAAEAARDSAAATAELVRAIIAQKMLAAPFAGRVGIRKLDLGQYVSPGTSLITLQQLDPIFVDFPIPEKSFDLLQPGQAIEVEIDANPGQIFRGAIKTVDARIAQDSRNVLVRGQLDNKKRQLWSGMFANVNVIAGRPKRS